MTLVIAHRGASADERENTVAAFRKARDLGADWVELDARRTADGVIVVHHDAHLADGRLIAEYEVGELPDELPSLAEALEACEGMGVNIEIKNLPDDPDFDADHLVSDAVAGLARAYLDLENVLVSSFNIDAIDRIKQIDPELPTAYLAGDMGDPARGVARTLAHGHQAFHPYQALVDPLLVERAHEAGIAINVWTVDDPDRIGELVRMRVDGIVTNDVATGRRVVDEVLSG
ncbi:MAG: glycerophosphodiester phosphodiesterase [Acidimicrobiia bacterium]|nr:glycerophosphodiester phosphodiesterase [Acidimicrobiia bacterium]